MAKLEEYISVGQKRLRCGYTTGTCAAAAARGAAELLLVGRAPEAVVIDTPAGISVTADLEEVSSGPGWAQCAVRKDGGDDHDATDGALVFARVERSDDVGIAIDGGAGVGRVTREGLDQPPGAAAINSVPRKMIAEQVQCVLDGLPPEAVPAGVTVTISVPEGERIAEKTFNPRLGIEGGISIIGTSGIVRPMSEEALIASIQLEMRMRKAEGCQHLLVVPGNYGQDFARDVLHLDMEKAVSCSNYLGATIDYAVELGFSDMLLVGHIGKMAKVAAGVMNTHSKVADARRETIAAHAACAGASRDVVRAIMEGVTTDEAIALLEECGLREPVMKTVCEAVEFQLRNRAGESLRIESIVFSKVHGLLGKSEGADELAALHV